MQVIKIVKKTKILTRAALLLSQAITNWVGLKYYVSIKGSAALYGGKVLGQQFAECQMVFRSSQLENQEHCYSTLKKCRGRSAMSWK